MSTELATTTQLPELSPEETALLTGDLAKLSTEQRASLITSVCRSLGLNPLTKPLQYIVLNGKLTLYATKDCTDQLRRIHQVSTHIVGREMLPGEIYVVTARATMPNGRTEERIGAVSVAGLRGEAMANALMKAETKAVRRVSLGSCGLGVLDELEVETIPGALRVEEMPVARITSHEDADDPEALDKVLIRLAHARDEIRKLNGLVVDIPDGLTLPEAENLLRRLAIQYRQAKAAASR